MLLYMCTSVYLKYADYFPFHYPLAKTTLKKTQTAIVTPYKKNASLVAKNCVAALTAK
jgi:hypothetical protein